MSISYKNMNRELFLSLGITILTSATLFMYFRQRFKIHRAQSKYDISNGSRITQKLQ